MRSTVFAALAALALSACATAPVAAVAEPSVTPAAGAPAPARGKLYADCVAQAIATPDYDRENNTLRFRCNGAPAQALYDALGPWSAAQDAELVRGATTYRTTQKVQRDLSGLDYCSHSPVRNPAHICVVVLNVGEFLTAP